MTVWRWLAAFARLVPAGLSLVLLGPGLALATPHDAELRAKFDGLRLPFIENQGQIDATVAYYAPTFAGTLFVTHRGDLVYSLPARTAKEPLGSGWTLTETLPDGTVRPVGTDRTASGVSYFLGNDPARWRPRVPSFARVSLGEVWPGITVMLRAGGRSIEKVFTVSPGASVVRIRVRVDGADALSVDGDGALVAETGRGPVTFTAPVAYQEHDGVRRSVAVTYRSTGREYGFTVAAYDRTRPLVIDPLLRSTYLGGGAQDWANALAIHPMTGDVYVAGFTNSTDFPGLTGGAQPTKGDESVGSAFVAHLTGDLTAVVQATYLGGSTYGCVGPHLCLPGDAANALAIHPVTGDVYVAGFTASTTFPGTAGGAEPTSQGHNGFVARLNEGLAALLQATYLDVVVRAAQGLAIHPATGDVYAAGGALARLNSALTTLTHGPAFTQAGSFGVSALAIHPASGDVYVSGSVDHTIALPGTGGGAQPTPGGGLSDAYVARFPSDLSALLQATYLGGSGSESASALAIHPATGDVYAAGRTDSPDFPGVTGGAQQTFPGSFVARLNSGLTALAQATYLGGSGFNDISALAIHPFTDEVYVAGLTSSATFPGTAGGVQPTKPSSGGFNVFVARLASSLTALAQATYLGGSAPDVSLVRPSLALNPMTGDVYVAGSTASTDFPGTAGGAHPEDGFVAWLTATLTAGADLTLAKAHSGNFFRGQAEATYVLTVSNVGATPTTGTVTVTDALPSWLTATALGGSGWSCTLGTLTCTRSNPLAPGSSYPPVTVTVTVAANAPGSLTNRAMVSGGADFIPGNSSAADHTAVTTFTDVSPEHIFYAWIEALVAAGITGGCSGSPPQYCPDSDVTRAHMAVFLLRGIHGAGYEPPAPTGTMFADVPAGHPFAKWIEQLAREGITGGCSTSPPQFCPDAPVMRGEMAVFLLRIEHGAGYDPPAATGTVFADVPATHPFAKWIEQLAREGITGGCSTSPPQFCPDATATRGQAAVFLVRTLNLSSAPPFAYVSNGDALTVIDTATNAVVATVTAGGPIGVAVNPASTRVYVADFGSDAVTVIDTATNAVAASIPVDPLPATVAVNPTANRAYVTHRGSGNLTVIDTATNTVAGTVPVGGFLAGVAVSPVGTRLYVGEVILGEIPVIDVATGTVLTRIPVGKTPVGVVVNPAGTRVYVTNYDSNTATVIDTASNTVVTTVPVGSNPAGVAVNPNGTRVYVANVRSNTVTVIDTASNTVLTTIPVGSGPAGVAVNPAGTRAYVTNHDGNTVMVIDTATNLVVGTVPVASPPIGVAVTGVHFFVPNAADTRTGAPRPTGN